MPITWLDFLLLGVMLVTGLLAMIRGFMREVLSIAAWGSAAVVTLLLYNKLLPYAKANISSDMLASVAVVGGVFLITLLLVSILTVRISDMIIVVVAFLFFSWLVPTNKLPDGVKNAKSRVVLQSTGEALQNLLPQDMDTYLSQWFKRRPKGGEQEPPDAPPPDQKSELGSPAVTG